MTRQELQGVIIRVFSASPRWSVALQHMGIEAMSQRMSLPTLLKECAVEIFLGDVTVSAQDAETIRTTLRVLDATGVLGTTP